VISDQSDGFLLVRDPDFLSTETPNDSASNFFVSPNPADDYIQVISNTESIEVIEVFNVLGQQILNFNLNKTATKTINTSALEAGVYFVKINGNTTKRVLIN